MKFADPQFKIPAPYRAWCHLCKEDKTVPGQRGQGFLTPEELQKHTAEIHGLRRTA
ncbi:MAG TPA: hypothetical protein VGF44_11345 [Terriglobales bacterium]|jgi:hypothetical protein